MLLHNLLKDPLNPSATSVFQRENASTEIIHNKNGNVDRMLLCELLLRLQTVILRICWDSRSVIVSAAEIVKSGQQSVRSTGGLLHPISVSYYNGK